MGAILIGDKTEFQEFKELIANKIELSDKRLQLLRSGKTATPVLGKLVCSCNNVGSINLQQAVESHPELFPARYNLANIYIEEQNFALVVELLRDIYVFTPELGETWYNYAVAFIKLNRSTEAVPIMRAYIERYQDDPARKSVVEKFRSALKPAATHDLDALLFILLL